MAQDYSYKDGIISSRVGCLGSSDAELVYMAGLTQRISKTLEKRLAVLKGFIPAEQKDILNFRKGNALEMAWFNHRKEYIEGSGANVELNSNPEYHYSVKFNNFRVIDHIDIEEIISLVDGKKIIHWSEVKCSSKDWCAALEHYQSQLAWHYLCLLDKKYHDENIDKVFLHLDVYPISEVELDNDKLEMTNFSEFAMDSLILDEYTVGRLMDRITVIMDGLKVIDNFLENFTHYEVEEITEVDAEDLPTAVQEMLTRLENINTEKKALEEEEKQLRADVLEVMDAAGLKTVRTPFTTFSVKEASTMMRFDSKRFKAEQPNVYKEYLAESKSEKSLQFKSRKD